MGWSLNGQRWDSRVCRLLEVDDRKWTAVGCPHCIKSRGERQAKLTDS